MSRQRDQSKRGNTIAASPPNEHEQPPQGARFGCRRAGRGHRGHHVHPAGDCAGSDDGHAGLACGGCGRAYVSAANWQQQVGAHASKMSSILATSR